MIEMLLNIDEVKSAILNLVETNFVGQPTTGHIRWTRGMGTNANIIYVLGPAEVGTTNRANLYAYDINTNIWNDLGRTTAVERMEYVPTLVAVSQNTLCYMALDIVYFYDIPTKVWTNKPSYGSTSEGYIFGIRGWYYNGFVYRYGRDRTGKVSLLAYNISLDQHIVSGSRGRVTTTDFYASTILIGSRIYRFPTDGAVISYADLGSNTIFNTGLTLGVKNFQTLLVRGNDILIFGDSLGTKSVRALNTITNTLTKLTDSALVIPSGSYAFNGVDNTATIYVGKRNEDYYNLEYV